MNYKIGYLHFEITNFCNLKCKYCFYYEEKKSSSREVFALKEIGKIINQINCFSADHLTYTLSGGEIFIRDDLYKILDLVSNRKIRLISNGLLIKESDILKLAYYTNLEEISISFDGMEGSRLNRGISKPEELWNTIKLISNKNIPISINTIITKHNIYKLNEFYKKIKDLPTFCQWKIDLPFFMGRYEETFPELLFSFNDLSNAIYNLLFSYKKDNMPFRLEIKNIFDSEMLKYFNKNSCDKINKIDFNDLNKCEIIPLTIHGNGDIGFLPAFPIKFGNIKKQSISEVLCSKQFNSFFKKMSQRKSRDCKKCVFFPLCEKISGPVDPFIKNWPCLKMRVKWIKKNKHQLKGLYPYDHNLFCSLQEKVTSIFNK